MQRSQTEYRQRRITMKMLAAFVMTVFFSLMSLTSFAQEGEAQPGPKVGLGAHLGWPALIGPSVKVWLNPRVGVQGMGAFFSVDDYSLTVLAGRVFFRLVQDDKKIFPYAGAGIGTWIAKNSGYDYVYNSNTMTWDEIKTDESESIATYEAFFGFEHKYSEEFHADYELGYYSIGFDEVDVDVSGISVSFAVHYFF